VGPAPSPAVAHSLWHPPPEPLGALQNSTLPRTHRGCPVTDSNARPTNAVISKEPLPRLPEGLFLPLVHTSRLPGGLLTSPQRWFTSTPPTNPKSPLRSLQVPKSPIELYHWPKNGHLLKCLTDFRTGKVIPSTLSGPCMLPLRLCLISHPSRKMLRNSKGENGGFQRLSWP
jgi:hypothetical protein